jgi:cold shock CspA family protein
MAEEVPMTNGYHSSSSISSGQTPEPSQPTSIAGNDDNTEKDSRESSRLTGTVKWFNAKCGYGFITRHDTGEDIFIHFSGISRKNPRHTIKSLGDGESVEFNLLATNVTGPDGCSVRGNPYVSHIPVRRRNDQFASGDPVVPNRQLFLGSSRIPRWIPGWQRQF